MPAGPDTVNYYGGITSASFSLNGATLETAPGDPASVLVTMLDTPPVLGIPGFHDGYSFTAGGASDSQGRRWALNVFFYGFNGGLPDLDAPSSLPDLSNFAVGGGYRSFRLLDGQTQSFDGFGGPMISIAAVPAPPALWLLATGLGAGWLRFRRRRD